MTTVFNFQFYGIGIYFALCFFVAGAVVTACTTVVEDSFDLEKTSSYECGFLPFDDARIRFDVHFYVIGVLFLIFDLEIVFLIPWVVGFENLRFVEFFFGGSFLVLLILSLYYEWVLGALDMFELA